VYTASRVGKGFGPVRVLKELTERGIEHSLARGVLDKYSADWGDKIRVACAKKFGAFSQPDVKLRAKQARFLEYRGYTGEQIHRLFAEDASKMS